MRRNAQAAPAGRSATTAAVQTHERGSPPPARGERFLAFEAVSYDQATRTADCIFSTGSRVERTWYTEELDISSTAVRLTRVVQNLVRLLFSHDAEQPIGVVLSARIENGRLVGQVRFNETPQGDLYAGMVQRRELTGLSVGYFVHQWTIISDADSPRDDWRATDWELLEVSLVSIPADPSAGIRSVEPSPAQAGSPAAPPAISEAEESDMRRNAPGAATTATPETPTPTAAAAASAAAAAATETRAAEPAVAAAAAAAPAAAAAAPVAETREALPGVTHPGLSVADALSAQAVARQYGVEEAIAPMLTRADTTVMSINQAILAARASQQHQQTDGVAAGSAGRITRDARDTLRGGVEEALLHRYRPGQYEITDRARQYRGMTLLDLGRECLEAIGENHRGLNRAEIASRALMSTSDFPIILGNVTNRTLRDAYDAAPRTFLPLARQTTLSDFKAAHRVQMSEAPQLLEVGENGEFKRGALTEGKETIQLKTYGRVIAVTRQVIINDDLGAFTRIPALWGNAVATLESDIVWLLILSNPTLLTDSTTLFHANHNNLKSSGGTAPDIASVSAARVAMSKQKGFDGKTLLNVSPKYIVTPPELSTAAEQLTTNITPADISKVVPERIRKLIPIEEARLSVGVGSQAGSTTAWYTAADPNLIDGLEYAFLEGQEGPFTDERVGFDVDGVEYKVRHDFAAAMLDFRGWYKNVGA